MFVPERRCMMFLPLSLQPYGASSERPETDATCSPAFAFLGSPHAGNRETRNPSSRRADTRLRGQHCPTFSCLSLGTLHKSQHREPKRIQLRIPHLKHISTVQDCEGFLSGAGAFAVFSCTSRFNSFPSTAYHYPWMMHKKKKNLAYIVWVGRDTGIFRTWKETHNQVASFPGSRYKGFTSISEAEMVWNLGFEEYEKGRLWMKDNAEKVDVPVKRTPPKVDPAIVNRAKALVMSSKGVNTFTCKQGVCVYPSCLCGTSQQ